MHTKCNKLLNYYKTQNKLLDKFFIVETCLILKAEFKLHGFCRNIIFDNNSPENIIIDEENNLIINDFLLTRGTNEKNINKINTLAVNNITNSMRLLRLKAYYGALMENNFVTITKTKKL